MSIFREWLRKLRPKEPENVWEAICTDNVDAVRTYLDGGVGVNERDEDGATLLTNATIFGALKTAQLLLEQGADPNDAEPGKQWRPLHFAAQNWDVPMTEILLSHGADVAAKDAYGNTCLWRAVFESEGRGELIRLLREHGADPYDENNHSVSPVSLAHTIDNYDVKQFFSDLPEPEMPEED